MEGTSAPPPANHPWAEAVALLRDIDLMYELDDVQRGLAAALEQGPRTLVVDMSKVVNLSSTTIAALLCIKRRCSTRGVDVVLRASSRRNVEMLQRIGLLGIEPTTSGTRSPRADDTLGKRP